MKTYLLQNDDNVLDESLFNVLNSMSIEFETLTLASDHQEINPLFNKLQGGIVFLPAAVCGSIVAMGAVLGGIGSQVSLKQFLEV